MKLSAHISIIIITIIAAIRMFSPGEAQADNFLKLYAATGSSKSESVPIAMGGYGIYKDVLVGMDFSVGETDIPDYTYNRYHNPEYVQSTSFGILTGYRTGSVDVLALFSWIDESIECPNGTEHSYLGLQCYAGVDSESPRTSNMGVVVNHKYIGVRWTANSFMATVSFEF